MESDFSNSPQPQPARHPTRPPLSSWQLMPEPAPGALPKLPCATCGGTGWLRVDRPLNHPRFGKLERCECQGDRELDRLRALSGLHGTELDANLDDMDATCGPGTEQMIDACAEFIREPGGFLTLWGAVGTGKSTCLYAITNALLRRGAVYVSLHDLLEFVKGGFESRGDDDAAARLKRIIAVPVLCLDELDKVKQSEWVAEELTALVDARFRSGMNAETGTVFALNSDPAMLAPWIASRLADHHCRIVHNADRDARPLLGG